MFASSLLLALVAAAPIPWTPPVDAQGRLFGRLDFISSAWQQHVGLSRGVSLSFGGWLGPNLQVPASSPKAGLVTIPVQLDARREDLVLMPLLKIDRGGLAGVALLQEGAGRELLRLAGPPEGMTTWGWRVPLGPVSRAFALRFELRGARLVDLALTSEGYQWAQIGSATSQPVNRAVFSANHDPTDEQQMKVWHERMKLAWSRPYYEIGRDWRGPRQVDWTAVRKRLEHYRQVHTPLVLLQMGALGHGKEGRAPEDWQAFYADQRWLAEEFARRFPAHEWDIKYVEMWNEPDDGAWFKVGWGGDPEHYSGFLRAAAAGIKAGDPHMAVATGGIADPAGGSLGGFLLRCLEEFHIGAQADALALHGYYGDPAPCAWDRSILLAREISRRHAGRELPILITEFNANFRAHFSKDLPFSKQSLYVAETLTHFLRRHVTAAMYFCFGWLGSDFCPYYYDSRHKLIERPVVEAYAFFADYQGHELKLQAPDYLFPIAACQHDGAAWVYFNYDGHTPVRLELADELAGRAGEKTEVYAFAGEKTQQLGALKRQGRRLDFPGGLKAPRGVVKLRLPLR